MCIAAFSHKTRIICACSFFQIFLAFGSFFYLHLSRVVYKYATPLRALISSVVASMGMHQRLAGPLNCVGVEQLHPMLFFFWLPGKFDIQEMASAHLILGPTMFFIFALVVIIILTNLLMTVIIMSFAEVYKKLCFEI